MECKPTVLLYALSPTSFRGSAGLRVTQALPLGPPNYSVLLRVSYGSPLSGTSSLVPLLDASFLSIPVFTISPPSLVQSHADYLKEPSLFSQSVLD